MKAIETLLKPLNHNNSDRANWQIIRENLILRGSLDQEEAEWVLDYLERDVSDVVDSLIAQAQAETFRRILALDIPDDAKRLIRELQDEA